MVSRAVTTKMESSNAATTKAEEAVSEAATTIMKRPGQVTTKDLKKVKLGERMVGWNCKNKEKLKAQKRI